MQSPDDAAEFATGRAAAGAALDTLGADPAWLQDLAGYDVRAVGAAQAAYQEDVASKHCVALAQWVQYFWWQVLLLQWKIVELEDWKRQALDDVRQMREEHKALKQRVAGGHGEHGDLDEEVAEELPRLRAATALPPTVGEDAPRPESPPSLGAPWNWRKETGEEGEVIFASQRGSTSNSVVSTANEGNGQLGGAQMTEAQGNGQLEGVLVTEAQVEGKSCEMAEWRIAHLRAKLKGCMGRTLVSPPFAAAGAKDVRLMVYPHPKDAAKAPRNKRQKALYAKKMVEGPLDACLKMKFAPNTSERGTLEYYLSVGSERRGPFTHDFTESTANGCDDFGVDWLKQLDKDQSLTLRVEIVMEARAAATGE